MTFDALTYFETLAKKNKLCVKNGFLPVFCSGPDSIEGIINNFQKTANFVCIDDTTDGNTYSEGVSYFHRSVYTVFIVEEMAAELGFREDQDFRRQREGP